MPVEHGTLILVDLDNVAGDLGLVTRFLPRESPLVSGRWIQGGEAVTVPTVRAADAPCVVVFAMNLETARDTGDSMHQHLDRVARHLAHFIANSSEVTVEIALTLVVPQAVDALLLRLLRRAPVDGHDGAFDRVCVLTEDGGLRRAVGQVLGRSAADEDTHCYAHWDCARAHIRARPSEHPRPACAPADIGGDLRAIVVDNDARASWATTQDLDAVLCPSLDVCATAIRRSAGLLAQIGPTTTSLRGLARLGALCFGAGRTIGDCSAKDGLELRCRSPVAGQRGRGSASPLGPGALCLADDRVTVGCRLPPRIAMAAQSIVVDDTGNVDLQATLDQVQLDGFADPVLVDLMPRGREVMLASVPTTAEQQPHGWWVDAEGVHSERRVHGVATLLGKAGLTGITAACALVGAPRNFCVVLRAPAASVRVASKIAADTLGLGTAGSRKFAVLAPKQGLGAGDHECVPIQDLKPSVFGRDHGKWSSQLAALQALPIVVPRPR